MNLPSELAQSSPDAHRLHSKIRAAVAALKVAACGYLLWVLWLVLAPLRAPHELIQWLGRAWHREVAGAAPWQLAAYLVIDLLGWALAAAACIACWRALSAVGQPQPAYVPRNWRHLTVGAWLAVAAELYSLLSRPLKSVAMTLHQAAPPLVAWSLTPHDVIVAMLCLALLVLAYVTTWNAQLAAENHGFV